MTTTPSRQPVVLSPWIKPGTHINAIGADAPGKQELDPAILKRARIVVDEIEQSSHAGELNVPISRGESAGRISTPSWGKSSPVSKPAGKARGHHRF